MSDRIESDSLGDVKVPSDKYYGAQTQRSFENFKIGNEKFPREFIRAYGILKKSAAIVNNKFGKLPDDILSPIKKAADEGSPGIFILIGFKNFLPRTFICFTFLFLILID